MALMTCTTVSSPLFAAEDNSDGDAEYEAESSESEGGEAEVQCLRDDDCAAGWICRDIGICVPLDCDEDADCGVSGFYCREDGSCAPEVCVYDRDCGLNEFCDNGECLTTPGEKGYPYVEGGSPNCNSGGDYGGVGLAFMVVLALLVSARRCSVR